MLTLEPRDGGSLRKKKMTKGSLTRVFRQLPGPLPVSCLPIGQRDARRVRPATCKRQLAPSPVISNTTAKPSLRLHLPRTTECGCIRVRDSLLFTAAEINLFAPRFVKTMTAGTRDCSVERRRKPEKYLFTRSLQREHLSVPVAQLSLSLSVLPCPMRLHGLLLVTRLLDRIKCKWTRTTSAVRLLTFCVP